MPLASIKLIQKSWVKELLREESRAAMESAGLSGGNTLMALEKPISDRSANWMAYNTWASMARAKCWVCRRRPASRSM
ncbi:hypothetical protein D3C85_1751370 [compost metagenome]